MPNRDFNPKEGIEWTLRITTEHPEGTHDELERTAWIEMIRMVCEEVPSRYMHRVLFVDRRTSWDPPRPELAAFYLPDIDASSRVTLVTLVEDALSKYVQKEKENHGD